MTTLMANEPVDMSETTTLKICAVMSIPRVGWNEAWGCIHEALRPFGIPVHRFSGVFWGQCMQRAFEEFVAKGVDWLLCIDYDSVFTARHVDRLLGVFGSHPEIDALAALQSRRGQAFPLATMGNSTEVEVGTEPLKVTTAHFGLTLLRAECIAKLPKPWFKSEPDANGEWSDDRLDDDIWFWHIWRQAGYTIYMDPHTRIGHLEMMVSDFDDQLRHRLSTMPQWRERQNVREVSEDMAPAAAGNGNGSA